MIRFEAEHGLLITSTSDGERCDGGGRGCGLRAEVVVRDGRSEPVFACAAHWPGRRALRVMLFGSVWSANMRARRLKAGWTQRQLSEMCTERGVPVSAAFLSLAERGIRAPRPALRRVLDEIMEDQADDLSPCGDPIPHEPHGSSDHVCPGVIAKGGADDTGGDRVGDAR